MIQFVNAKINIGLQIVARREDGYHELQTLFYPIGVYAGLPDNPTQFCDIIEINLNDKSKSGSADRDRITFIQSGNAVDCPPENNLAVKAAHLFFDTFIPDFSAEIRLEKHIPDGAGIGGGSADATFVLRMLNDLSGVNADYTALSSLALKLGADCPFFLLNKPAYACGVGEKLELLECDDPLRSYWLLLVKPDVYISTKEAFSGVHPHPSDFNLKSVFEVPVEEWRNYVHNDFEDSIFPAHPEFALIKEEIYHTEALYASLTGSGSCLYGIYKDKDAATEAQRVLQKFPTIMGTYLLKL